MVRLSLFHHSRRHCLFGHFIFSLVLFCLHLRITHILIHTIAFCCRIRSLSVYRYVCRSIVMSVVMTVCLSVYRCLSVCLSLCLSFCISLCLSVYLSVCRYFCLSACLLFCLSVKFNIHLSIIFTVCYCWLWEWTNSTASSSFFYHFVPEGGTACKHFSLQMCNLWKMPRAESWSHVLIAFTCCTLVSRLPEVSLKFTAVYFLRSEAKRLFGMQGWCVYLLRLALLKG